MLNLWTELSKELNQAPRNARPKTPQHIDLFDFRALIVVSPESSVSPESLIQAAERGKLIFVIAGVGDGMFSWANGVGVPALAYPPSDVDINKLYEEMRRADAGNLAADDQYRRAVWGSDMSARIQSGMAVRKIAITSPKGGTGKTTVAVNLAVALALSGITTYLVDADGNAGALQYQSLTQGWISSTRILTSSAA